MPSELHPTIAIVQEWIDSVKKRTIDFEGNPSVVFDVGRDYGKMKGLLLVQIAANYSANFYFDGSGHCVMVYVNDFEILDELDEQMIFAHYGEPELVTRARVGGHKHHIYARQGFAFASRNGVIRFFEAFPRRTTEKYMEEVYWTWWG